MELPIECICRICFQELELHLLFGKDEDGVIVADKIMMCFNLKIEQLRNEPDKICDTCLSELNAAYRFRNNCENANVLLQKLTKGDSSEVPEVKLPTTLPTQIEQLSSSISPLVDEIDNYELYIETDNESSSLLPTNKTENNEKNDIEIKEEHEVESDIEFGPYTVENTNKVIANTSETAKKNRENMKKLSVLWACSRCNYLFKNKNRLNLHMRRHHPNMLLKCGLCSKAFATKLSLNYHLAEHNTSSRIVSTCRHCTREFASYATRDNHERLHAGSEAYKCEMCGEVYFQMVHLQRHMEYKCKKGDESSSNAQHCDQPMHLKENANQENLITVRKKKTSTPRKKRVLWTNKHVAILINVWAQYASILRRIKRNRHVFAAMSEELKKRGVNMTANEVKIKIWNLTGQYRTCKRNGTSSNWEFFEDVENIINGNSSKVTSLVAEAFDVESKRTSSRKKRSLWTNKNVAILISVWAEYASDLRRTKRNRQVFVAMTEVLKKRGVNMAVNEVKCKIANLTGRYRSCKRNGGTPSDWNFFEDVGNIINGNTSKVTTLMAETFDDESKTSTTRKRRVFWTKESEAILIDVWAEYASDLCRTKRNSRVLAAMTEVLKKRGVNMVAREVKTKISNFTMRYRACKRNLPKSGGSNWIFFEDIGKIIGGNKSNDTTLAEETLDYEYVDVADVAVDDAGPSEDSSLIDGTEA